MVITMKLALFFLLFTAPLFAQVTPIQRVPLLREGTKIYEATGALKREAPDSPLSITIEQEVGGVSNTLIVLPNERLAEMEAATLENANGQFRFSGEVFAYGSQNFSWCEASFRLATMRAETTQRLFRLTRTPKNSVKKILKTRLRTSSAN